MADLFATPRRRMAALAVCCLFATPPAAPADDSPSPPEPPEGKRYTDRSIELVVVVDGSVERLFDLWSTPEGVDRFFGSGSTVEPRAGGLYEIYFGRRPDGEIAGTRGTRILRYEPPSALDFEWEMPFFAQQLNRRPLPTWVEVRLEPFGDDPPRTEVRVTHHGFGRGEGWDRSYVFFQRNWFEVLFRLKLHCAFFSEADAPAG